MNQNQISEDETRLRSELAQLIAGSGWVRGNLSIRHRVCGTPTCRCARGERHQATYLVASTDGKMNQQFIPKAMEETAQDWVANYQRIRDLLEELSQLQKKKLKSRKR